jgi:hypothetical protein
MVRIGGGLATYNSPVLLKRTLISGNTASSGAEVHVREVSIDDFVVAGNFNLLGHRRLTNAKAFTRFIPGATDLTATSNGNTPTALRRILAINLADRGGLSQTHTVVAGSPAVDAVNDGTCPPPARDQRGARRPQDGNGNGGQACDIGSFERQ